MLLQHLFALTGLLYSLVYWVFARANTLPNGNSKDTKKAPPICPPLTPEKKGQQGHLAKTIMPIEMWGSRSIMSKTKED